jgi:hypothetical protein
MLKLPFVFVVFLFRRQFSVFVLKVFARRGDFFRAPDFISTP